MTWKDIVEFGNIYGEAFERSQAEKWVKGQNSSKAVRVLLAVIKERIDQPGKMEGPQSSTQVVQPAPKPTPIAKMAPKPAPLAIQTLASKDTPPTALEEEDREDYLERVAVPLSEGVYVGESGRWVWGAAMKTTAVCWDDVQWTTKRRLEVGDIVKCGNEFVELLKGGACRLA